MIDGQTAAKSGAISLQKALLCGVSFIAWGIIAGPPARAQTISTSTSSTVNSTGQNIFVNPNVDLTGNPGISNATVTNTISSQGTIAGAGQGITNTGTIGTLSNLSPGTIITTGTDGIYSQGSINSLINSGLIAASGGIAIYNQFDGGSISTLTNSGTLTGDTGLSNQGNIGTATNADGGTIAGSLYGVYSNGNLAALINDSGATISGVSTAITVYNHTITTLTNNGLVTGTIGVDNLNGTVVNLSNSGTISASATGTRNSTAIGTISNSGTISAEYAIINEGTGTIGAAINQSGGLISAASSGIDNFGVLHTLTNSGTISVGVSGIYNDGQLDTLTNNGTILGKYGIANGDFDSVLGTISTIVNTGTITATTGGLLNAGSIGTITNSGSIYGGEGGLGSDNFIGTLANLANGTIAGYEAGAGNSGTIIDFTNAGLIEATATDASTIAGVANIGTIFTLSNETGGTISGYYDGILNAGTIGNLSNATNATISSYSSSLENYGAIGTLTNSGLIESLQNGDGIYNGGAISTLVNILGGTITGPYEGISNYGTISLLNNAGLISAESGLYSYEGSITSVTNSGTIAGTEYAGFNLTGYVYSNGESTSLYESHIGTLTNTGLISGAKSGIFNAGSIGSLGNSGTITGSIFGVYNQGALPLYTYEQANALPAVESADTYSTITASIASLTNNGTISGTEVGVYNGGFIGSLTNTGTIAAPDGTAIVNYSTIINVSNGDGGSITVLGTIGTITNGGLITGDYGIGNEGTISAIGNAGTISSIETALYNVGQIGALTNSGTITSSENAAIVLYGYEEYELSPSIDTLSNLAGGVISGNDAGIVNQGTIGALINNGLIAATVYGAGLYNYAVINTLTNNAGGTISGGDEGIFDAGAIGSVTNSGVITGYDGFYGYYGSIGAFSNSGTVAGTGYAGFDLSGYAYANGGETTAVYETQIGALTNSGQIIGAGTGLYNGGTIGALVNSGTITGSVTGIYNSGYLPLYDYGENVALARPQLEERGTQSTIVSAIGSLANSGLIFGGQTAIDNAGYIGTISNSGTIYGSIAGIYDGPGAYEHATSSVFTNGAAVSSASTQGLGTIGTISNSGLISGGNTGIYTGGSIGAINNTGTIFGNVAGIYEGTGGTSALPTPGTIGAITNTGTILGATGIYLSGGGTTITNGGTIASTNGGNALYFGGVDDLILTTGSDIIGTIDGGGTASQIALEGTGSLDAPIADFGAGGALAIAQGADWTGTGSWAIPTITNDGIFQGGRPGAPLTLTGNFVQNADGTLRVPVTPTTSTVFNINGTASLSGSVNYILAPGQYEPHTYIFLTANNLTGNFTSINYGDIPTALVEKAAVTTAIIGDPAVALVINVPFSLPLVVAPEDSTIFSAQSQALAETTDADTASLLDKAIYGGAASSPACAAEAPLAPNKTAPGGASQSGQIASALASVFCGAGGWIEATGSLSEANSSAGAPSYNANTAGFLAGVDKVLDSTGTRLGFAVGYDQTYLSDKLGGGGSMGTTRVAVYGSQPLGAFTLAGVIAYGNANNSTSRVSGMGDLHENNSASILSGGFEINTDLMERNIEIVPAAGLRVASVGGGAKFAEAATGITQAFAVTGRTSTYDSVQPYAEVTASQSFLLPSGWTVRPNAEAGYEYEAGTHGVSTTLFAADGTVFHTAHNDLDDSDALLSAGVTAGKVNWSVFATYTAHLAGNWNTQTAELGLRYTF
jgi:hypothetical protein